MERPKKKSISNPLTQRFEEMAALNAKKDEECGQQSSKKRRRKAKNKKQGTNNIDIIEGLDVNDQINLIGVKNKSISIQETSALGEIGIGIFAKGSLEALYVGSELSSAQLLNLTTGLNK